MLEIIGNFLITFFLFLTGFLMLTKTEWFYKFSKNNIKLQRRFFRNTNLEKFTEYNNHDIHTNKTMYYQGIRFIGIVFIILSLIFVIS